MAGQLTRLPAGNLAAVLTAARRDSLTAVEVQGVVDLLRGASREQEVYVLGSPRAALRQEERVPVRDPHLSPAGIRRPQGDGHLVLHLHRQGRTARLPQQGVEEQGGPPLARFAAPLLAGPRAGRGRFGVRVLGTRWQRRVRGRRRTVGELVLEDSDLGPELVDLRG
jgi:hypothetical protein